ncbi:MAG: hypothetical protein TEF_11060 [Rhizobiales bacterium NRL2]|jgi:competence protein ComEC|nr:MAG: hypothetical protein TEF_11060 [Rhizobiales bacterium NRL2]
MYHIPAGLTRRLGAAAARLLRDPAGALAAALEAERGRLFNFVPVLFGGGIAVYFGLPFEPALPWLGFLAVLAMFAAVQLRATPIRLPALACLLVVLGLAAAALRTEAVRAPILPAEVGPTELAGEVLAVERRPDAARLVIAPDRFGRLRAEDMPQKVRISVRTGAEAIRAGDTVTMLAVAGPPSPPAEPGAFDFQRYAFYRGLGGYGYALGAAEIVRPGEGSGWLSRLRDRMASRIAGAIGGAAGGVAAALITGDRSRIGEAEEQALRDAGLAHLLAISGLHMGLVTGFLFFGLRALLALHPPLALRRPIKKWAALAAIAGGAGYLVLTGGSVPTVRAFVMVALVMLAVLADRRAISLRTVALAAMLILALSPEALVEPGFQMSFAAVTALVAAYERYGDRWRRSGGERGLLRRIGGYLAGVALTTLIAGAATGPFAIYHFNRFADYGVLGNLAGIPLVAFWVMPTGTLAALAMPFGLDGPLLWLMGQGIDAVLTVAHWVAALPGAVRLVPAMPVWGLSAVALGGLWLCLWSRGWRVLGLGGIAIGLASPHLAERPLIRVDSDARLVAVRTEAGAVMLSSTRREKFTADQWLARDGLTGSLPWPARLASPDGRMRCDDAGCIWRADGWMIALPVHQRAVAEDCTRADVVISLVPVFGRCPSARIVIDRFDIWREGAHALWFDARAGPSARSVNAVRGRRPWIRDPVPAKDQYWRKRAVSRP